MINVLTTNSNTKIIERKLSKIFISEVCIKLVALRINRYTRSSSHFQKDWWHLKKGLILDSTSNARELFFSSSATLQCTTNCTSPEISLITSRWIRNDWGFRSCFNKSSEIQRHLHLVVLPDSGNCLTLSTAFFLRAKVSGNFKTGKNYKFQLCIRTFSLRKNMRHFQGGKY